MKDRMVLVMIDECGDEVVVDRFSIGDELDDDYMQLWKEMKIEKARSEYPEARGFYFEDKLEMTKQVNALVREDNGWYDDEDEEDEWEEVDDGFSQNAYCDNYGVCGGPSCPQYYSCH
jgi:hypothetical protein